MQAKLSSELLGLAGEYAVASELCRHGVYAQLTLGNHKQTDILVETKDGMLRISVKTKQGNEWPRVDGPDDFLVLVDLNGKHERDRPEFYILDITDWNQLIDDELQRNQGSTRDERGRFTYRDGFKGLNIKPEKVRTMLEQWREQWHKIVSHSASSDKS